MASKVLFAKQEINWLSLIPKLIVIGILCLCFYPLEKQGCLLISIFFYFLLTLLAKWLFFPNVLYEGMKLIREEKFQEAIPRLEDTIDYFVRNLWIDKFRFLLLISSAKRSIKESTICNLAYCYLQVGNVKKATETYEDVLLSYPDNWSAKAVLNMINIVSLDKTRS